MPQFPPFKDGINISLKAALGSDVVPNPCEHCGTWYPAGAQHRAAALPVANGGLTEPLASPAGPGWRIGAPRRGRTLHSHLAAGGRIPRALDPERQGLLPRWVFPLR